MARKAIDMTKDPRGGQFEYFRSMTDPWAGITVPVDITELLVSLHGRPFFLSFLYAVMRAANAVPELRRRLLPDGQVVEYDHCDPSYTVMKPDGTDDSNPRFAWGKYREENGRTMLPMSLFINHALCDGWHVTQFYRNLDRELAELSKYLKAQNEQQEILQ